MWELTIEKQLYNQEDKCLQHVGEHLRLNVYTVVLRKLIPAQICQLIRCISND